ncbi:MAG: hypothetical protein GXO22_07340 [Aquificae bacterium]|nr:hypothetical protein [Aquificota bacterium]
MNTALGMGFYPISPEVLEGKVNDIQEEIDLLKNIVADAKKNPFFRQLATQIINSFPCQHKNYDCYVYAVAKWVRDNIKYIKDITGYETLQTPENTLAISGGDCDDHAILVATLLNAIGIKTAFKIVGKDGKYKHIYVIAITPKGKKWVVDTTEEEFFYPLEKDKEYEMEILQDLEGLEELGWGFKIKFKPKKFVKRATGGIRRPSKLVKRIKRKPLAFANKRFRQVIPKPLKAQTRAFSPLVKPIKKIEKISPVKGFKPAKAVKRATASKSIDEAATKIAATVVAVKSAAPYLAKAVPKTAALKTVATKTGGMFLNTARQVAVDKNKTAVNYYILPVSAQKQKTETNRKEDLLKNPLVIAAGILAVGLLFGGRR